MKKKEAYVRNPETNRLIKVNGLLYQKLVAKGVTFEKPKHFKAPFTPVLDKDVSPHVKRNKSFRVDRENTPWEQKKPHSMKERRTLFDRCGEDAFLLPKALKFPIANKIDKKSSSCTYNCRGLKAASSRAGEWKYKNVLEKSKRLTKELDCYKKK